MHYTLNNSLLFHCHFIILRKVVFITIKLLIFTDSLSGLNSPWNHSPCASFCFCWLNSKLCQLHADPYICVSSDMSPWDNSSADRFFFLISLALDWLQKGQEYDSVFSLLWKTFQLWSPAQLGITHPTWSWNNVVFQKNRQGKGSISQPLLMALSTGCPESMVGDGWCRLP